MYYLWMIKTPFVWNWCKSNITCCLQHPSFFLPFLHGPLCRECQTIFKKYAVSCQLWNTLFLMKCLCKVSIVLQSFLQRRKLICQAAFFTFNIICSNYEWTDNRVFLTLKNLKLARKISFIDQFRLLYRFFLCKHTSYNWITYSKVEKMLQVINSFASIPPCSLK